MNSENWLEFALGILAFILSFFTGKGMGTIEQRKQVRKEVPKV